MTKIDRRQKDKYIRKSMKNIGNKRYCAKKKERTKIQVSQKTNKKRKDRNEI